MDRELGDHQVLEPPDAVGRLHARGHPTRELLSESLLEGHDTRCAGQLEHVDRVEVVREGHDRHFGRHLPDGQRDVAVVGVRQVRDDDPRPLDADVLVGVVDVATAGHDRHALDLQLGRLGRIRLEHDVRDPELGEPLDQRLRDRVVAADHDVRRHVVPQAARGAHADLGLEPGRVEKNRMKVKGATINSITMP